VRYVSSLQMTNTILILQRPPAGWVHEYQRQPWGSSKHWAAEAGTSRVAFITWCDIMWCVFVVYIVVRSDCVLCVSLPQLFVDPLLVGIPLEIINSLTTLFSYCYNVWSLQILTISLHSYDIITSWNVIILLLGEGGY